MGTEVVEATAFKAMQTDLQVSMDDVVSAFVSQYENNLFARKKELGAEVKRVEKELSDVTEIVRAKVTGDEFAKEKLPFGLKLKVEDGVIDWSNDRVNFTISIKKDFESRYGAQIQVQKTKPIPVAQIRAYKKLTDELEQLRSNLGEVLVNLKSVTRKERQVRGRIAMRKLEDSGYASLMQDEELAQLVQLDD